MGVVWKYNYKEKIINMLIASMLILNIKTNEEKNW